MGPSDRNVLEVQGLTVRFDTSERSVVAVKDLGFHVRAGEVLAIVGESGSGKSVTSLSVMRLIEHGGGTIASGKISFTRRNGGKLDLAKAADSVMRTIRGGEISMIFQEPMTSLNPVFSVGTQVAEAVMLHQGLSHAEAEAEALRMLELVRIPEAKQILKRYPHQLSGGMRQRVMIAMALSCKPSLLIADEPTTALDVTIQAQILQLIRQLQEEMGMAVIFITHDMGVVAEVADRVLVMYHGEAVEEGTCEQIFHNPRHPYTQSLLAAVPRLGSMRGTDEPAPFPLLRITDPEAEQLGTADMDETPVDMPEPVASVPSVSDGPVLSVDNLITRFDVETGFWGKVKRRVHAVEQVSFNLYPGETLGLVGESGCGKSTIGRSLIGLETPRSGSIVFNGQELTQVSGSQLQKLRRNIQYVFQDPYAALDPRLTVGFSIMEPLLIHKVCSRQEAERRVGELLERVDLDPAMAVRYPHEFSGGQRQRVCIARALAMNPEIIIADESVSALDVSVRAQIINLLLALQKEFRIAFLFISHDMAVIERVCHRVAVMYLGQIVELGSRRDVFENPLHPYTKRLMSAVPIPDPSRRTMSHTLLTGEIPSPVRSADYEPVVAPLKEVSPGHFVSEEQVANWF
ncbi:MAG TPA: dipeptide ABC transporter ATP-binding protein [Bilophila wadsworthia]|jgi:glutathione transport system ATP-binding protein|uniref:dipeptide ABC transporter ATP-binding protein n=1 Tax=Bilophila wadsworthia TaxID=35833 RepID=UPI001D0BE479|nr:dipeptide ABC transporter ATP-binding protein [Bilophila wadsworthia]MCB8569900.1 dipeptide ABC transporter ATP-binding protein [Bilophila wadsworthia]MCC2713920.1 dipeptide ABC transporter ATP-binding protein [Bilophila wadsworthia]HJH16956.1 dipeptide ABC transporter ATP-binding protein [Bilophila wadsworthia]